MLLGFKKQFVDPILIGTKVHTMRKRRKIKPKIGETLHMYTALRTKHCQLITNREKLISIQKVRILIKRDDGKGHHITMIIDGRKLQDLGDIREVALYDGFSSLNEFCEYWLRDEKGRKINRVSAYMDMYHWTDLKY